MANAYRGLPLPPIRWKPAVYQSDISLRPGEFVFRSRPTISSLVASTAENLGEVALRAPVATKMLSNIELATGQVIVSCERDTKTAGFRLIGGRGRFLCCKQMLFVTTGHREVFLMNFTCGYGDYGQVQVRRLRRLHDFGKNNQQLANMRRQRDE